MFNDSLENSGAKDVLKKSHLLNNYFEQNAHKYTKVSDDDNNPMHVFEVPKSTDELLRLKFCDSFLTRYVYHSFARYFKKLGVFLGVVEQ